MGKHHFAGLFNVGVLVPWCEKIVAADKILKDTQLNAINFHIEARFTRTSPPRAKSMRQNGSLDISATGVA